MLVDQLELDVMTAEQLVKVRGRPRRVIAE
jgi:hypothetical protein